ncbi:MAG: triose-phosphate isomerase [Minisyncoccales bacterium]
MIIVANWKCNPTNTKKVKQLLKIEEGNKKTKVIICPPFLYLDQTIKLTKNKNIKIGAQNCFWENSGSYTGEVSPLMLSNFNCEYVIIGHSERRKYLKEDSVIINRKIKKSLENLEDKVKEIENNKEIKKGRTFEVLKSQIKKALKGIDKKVIIAYEPRWAIGSGNNCDPEEVEKITNFIKKQIKTKVLYGGSVNKKNANDYLRKNIQGLLIGGASLRPNEFNTIIKLAKE